MYRAQSARKNLSDEIPLAKRSSPLRRPTPREYRLIAFISISLTVGLLLLAFSLPSRFRRTLSLFWPEAVPSSDGRLLGHYPYPEASNNDLITVYPGLELHKDTYKALKLMRAAAAYDGIDLVFLSGYRSIDLQRQIFYGTKKARNQIAVERAKVSAPPGYSEHSTGYAIDLGDARRRDTDFEVEFANTDAFKWLEKNAAKYHFVMSFPKGNAQKVSYEPWHWRFEGTVEALRQFEAANESRRKAESLN